MRPCEGVVNWIAYIANYAPVKSASEASACQVRLQVEGEREDAPLVINGCLLGSTGLMGTTVKEMRSDTGRLLLPSRGKTLK